MWCMISYSPCYKCHKIRLICQQIPLSHAIDGLPYQQQKRLVLQLFLLKGQADAPLWVTLIVFLTLQYLGLISFCDFKTNVSCGFNYLVTLKYVIKLITELHSKFCVIIFFTSPLLLRTSHVELKEWMYKHRRAYTEIYVVDVVVVVA